MKWTTKKPRKGGTGFYWFHMFDSDETHWEHPFIVHVTYDGVIECAYVQRCGLPDRIPLQNFGSGDPDEPNWTEQWFGPLQYPHDDGVKGDGE